MDSPIVEISTENSRQGSGKAARVTHLDKRHSTWREGGREGERE